MIFKKKTEEEKIRDRTQKVQGLMEKFGITSKRLDAEEVEIHMKDRDIVITKPDILVTQVMDREVFQITGVINEISKELPKAREDDVRMLMEQTGKDKETVSRKLQELDYDLAKAIRELKKMEK